MRFGESGIVTNEKKKLVRIIDIYKNSPSMFFIIKVCSFDPTVMINPLVCWDFCVSKIKRLSSSNQSLNYGSLKSSTLDHQTNAPN